MNFKIENKYYLKIPKDFLEDFSVNQDNLITSVKDYIHNYYLKNKQKTFKSNLSNLEKIIFHKVQVNDNNRSSKKSKRVLIFILLNNPIGINTIFPVFAFTTQQEKKYTTNYLKSYAFVKKIINNFGKYKNSTDIDGNKINEILGIEI